MRHFVVTILLGFFGFVIAVISYVWGAIEANLMPELKQLTNETINLTHLGQSATKWVRPVYDRNTTPNFYVSGSVKIEQGLGCGKCNHTYILDSTTYTTDSARLVTAVLEKLSEKISNIQNMIKEKIYQFSPPRDSPFLHIYIIIILLVLLVVLQALGILNFYTNGEFILIVLIEIMLWNIYWEYFHDLMDN